MSAPDDLFAVADAVAALVGAPVTVEDADSAVLAHSSHGIQVDPARVSTIVDRRVPADVRAHLRSRGVFRRLARSAEPFQVAADDRLARGRFVVPVRAADEWLGSIWVVTDTPPPPEVSAQLQQAAGVVALQLLQRRAAADLARQARTQAVRSLVTTGEAPGGNATLPAAPWRVAALAAAGDDPDAAVAQWDSLLRRRGWRSPALGVAHGHVVAVLPDHGGASTPGTWPWLRSQDLPHEGRSARPTAGRQTVEIAGLPRSCAEAVELARTGGAHTAYEQAWAELTLARAVNALDDLEPEPLRRLAEEDERGGSEHLRTLAAWLDHQGEPGAAAASLHLHRNTMRYRMDRIRELADLGLQDPRARVALRLHLLRRGH